MPMVFEKETKIFNNTIKSYRYTLPTNVFDHPNIMAENQCYCNMDSGACPPQGFFNTTPCNFGAPAFISLPHFFKGDAKIAAAIEGLKPDPELHKSYVDINPKLGFPMSGYSRLQINVQVQKSFGFSQLNMFSKDMILPIAWFDVVSISV